MASIAESGLFPAVINPFMPAFNIVDVKDNGLQIKFNLSDYNTISNIKSVHVSITRQANYISALKKTSYPLGIWVGDFSRPNNDSDALVTVPFSDLETGQLSYNEYYKVQVRLSSDNNPHLTGLNLSNYLTSEGNLIKFSEWSTVCLIRFIAPPQFELDANGIVLGASSTTDITTSTVTLSGVYSKPSTVPGFTDAGDQIQLREGTRDLEYLSSYRVKVFNSAGSELLFESPEQEVNIHNMNIVNYTIPYYFENGVTYKIGFDYVTANLYTPPSTLMYGIRATYPRESWNTSGNDVDERVSIDTVIGKVNVNIVSRISHEEEVNGVTNEILDPIPRGSKIVIRRSSDASNFTIWDTIWTKTIGVNEGVLSYDDFTIESGELYKYEITYTNLNDNSYFIVEGPIISVFDHAFLTGEGTQLCVKFNPNISSFRRNVSDNSITTIGSQYPFVTRNGKMDYRVFSLSGTIAYEMDAEHQFSSRTDIYSEWINVYGTYFVNHFINQMNDRITQRKFRELVMDYLYDDMPKLFRSTPEGNILVRITDVNLTPKQELARMIYDFSCTATEIGEASVENCKLYQIQDFGD